MARPVSCRWWPRPAIVPPVIGAHNLLTYVLGFIILSTYVESNNTSERIPEIGPSWYVTELKI